ncbi:NAD(P)-binding protein [Hanseniaspora valbyensis NRRL Y-1626]|uniref:NAD(P)-binding protein n=1 Tax=Hanseniaspora valbyensis NRRL Y-1626 TaxID=766949 RepID=A0A1B7TB69_9ASCO|nr:NAD(P)-binding protein [Hanseniaspora valbyensis NRRL Y-1626]
MVATTQKYALVTGASSGIGYEMSKQLVQKLNYKVFACARRKEKLLELQKELGEDKVIPLELDVSKLEDIQKAKVQVSAELKGKGTLNLLYNNAGQSCTFPGFDVTHENLEQVFKVNVFGPMDLCREFGSFLIESKGIIAFTGSLAGVGIMPFGSVYSATKAAIHAYARVLHLEMKPFGVKILNVITGGVDTDIADTRPLPESSCFNFKEGKAAFEYRQKMAKHNKPMSAKEYCSSIIVDIMKLSDGSEDPVDVWRGSKVGLVRFVMAWIPYAILEWGFAIKFKLNPIFKAVKNEEANANLSRPHLD